jgi:hypothetical protein
MLTLPLMLINFLFSFGAVLVITCAVLAIVILGLTGLVRVLFPDKHFTSRVRHWS